MPRDGALTFSDLNGRLDVLRVRCERCDLNGRYSVAKLTADHGRDGRLVEWFGNLTRHCPLMNGNGAVRVCDAVMPDLPRVWLTPSDECAWAVESDQFR
jgi:hypothetical protein